MLNSSTYVWLKKPHPNPSPREKELEGGLLIISNFIFDSIFSFSSPSGEMEGG
jgi:hypothetical protein